MFHEYVALRENVSERYEGVRLLLTFAYIDQQDFARDGEVRSHRLMEGLLRPVASGRDSFLQMVSEAGSRIQ